MPQPVRRLAALTSVLALAFTIAAGTLPTPAAAADLTVPAAEQAMLGLLNADRQNAGLVAVRVDSRLMAIARARATDMATRHYFGHTQPDGRSVFDIIQSKGIVWYGAGEIIAWNTWPTLADSAKAANDGWLGSPGHRAIVMSGSYNYVGVGLAVDASNGRKLWVGVFMKGPDRTGGWVQLDSVRESAVTSVASTASRVVGLSWRGGDVQLVVLTAGFREYQIQTRTDGGAWVWRTRSTTATRAGFLLWQGHTYLIRVRACDRRSNCGPWAYVTLRG